MKKIFKRILLTIILCVGVISITSCGLLSGLSGSTTTIGNQQINITTEITEKVVDYQNISITNLENAVQETISSVERSVLGIIIKQVTYVRQGFTSVRSEDDISYASCVVYKRLPIYENEQLVSYEYYAVTNRHAVVKEDIEYVIYVYDGYSDVEVAATLVGYDTKVDMAVIKFTYSKYIDPVEFADETDMTKGSFVIAIGNPTSFNYFGTATFGIISGDLRYDTDDTDGDGVKDFTKVYIQHDAAINAGSSGGGLFTIDGKLLGINTMKLIAASSTVLQIDNMNFAIPITVLETLIYEYIEPGNEIVRPKLGISGVEVKQLTPAVLNSSNLLSIPDTLYTDSRYGVYITEVTSNGTADNAGIEKDDIILMFDNERITSITKLTALLNSLTDYKIGDSVIITYYDRSANSIVEKTAILK